MKASTLGVTPSGRPVPIDLERLVETRLLLQANSGGGKSWAIRRILEQTHGCVQQLVLDVEDEFHTLRERYDYVLAGRHGCDCPADVRSAPLLARRLLELGVSAIVGIHELRAHERVRFVRLFLEALVEAPRELWRPALIVVDEAHHFCPQHGEAESAGAVIDLMTRGRKRGFCGILATQRIAKLHKDAAAEANNKLIGRSALDVDMKRAADELGFTAREDQARLRALQPGHFFAFGPAIAEQVIEVEVGPVETTHPRPGERAAPAPPPRGEVKRVLAQLADLPREAEAEARTVVELQGQVRQLKCELAAARRPRPEAAADPAAVAKAFERAEAHYQRLLAKALGDLKDRDGRIKVALGRVLDLLSASFDDVELPRLRPASAARSLQTPRREPAEMSELPKGERRILLAAAQHPGGVSREQLTVLTGYKRSSRDTYLQRLRQAGHVEDRGGTIVATEEGLAALGVDFEPLPTGQALLEHWLRELPEGERRILEIVVAAWPESIERAALDEATGYRRSSRDTYLQRLRARRLVEESGRGAIRASPMLCGE